MRRYALFIAALAALLGIAAPARSSTITRITDVAPVLVETPSGVARATRPSHIPEEVFLKAHDEFVLQNGYSPFEIEPGDYTCPDEILPGLGPTVEDQLLTNSCTVRTSVFPGGESYPWIFYMDRGPDWRPTKGLIVEGVFDRWNEFVDYAWPADEAMHFYNLFCDGTWMLVDSRTTGICLRAYPFYNEAGDPVWNMGPDMRCAQTPRPACWPY